MKTPRILFTICACLILVLGCGGPVMVDAVPRTSKLQPEFGLNEVPENTAPENSLPARNKLDVGFFHEDHFACLEIDVAQITSNSELAEVPWTSLEEQLAVWLGAENANLKKIDRAWLLVDREKLSLDGAREAASPFVYVLEYSADINQMQLDQAIKSKQSPGKPGTSFVAAKLTEKRIGLGDASLVAKLGKNDGLRSGLAMKFSRLELSPDINGVLIIEPVRSLLKSLFGMAAGFSEESRKLALLPDVTQHLELQLSIEGDELLDATIFLEDIEATKNLASMLNSGLVADNANAESVIIAMAGQQPELMIAAQSPQIMQDVANEIRESQLLTVIGKENSIEIKLKRPKKIKQLITAMVEDGRNQVLLMERQDRFTKIAEALKKYETQYGQLPSSDAALDETKKLRSQFSWRVALLPELGEQVLYDRFDFGKSWDSPENLAVAQQMPEVFADAASRESSNKSKLHIVAGKNGLYRGDRLSPKLADVKDKLIWTAIVVEGSPATAEVWTKPGALQADTLSDESYGVSSEAGVLIVNGAFKTRIVKKGNALNAVLSDNGDETMTRKDFLDATLPGR